MKYLLVLMLLGLQTANAKDVVCRSAGGYFGEEYLSLKEVGNNYHVEMVSQAGNFKTVLTQLFKKTPTWQEYGVEFTVPKDRCTISAQDASKLDCTPLLEEVEIKLINFETKEVSKDTVSLQLRHQSSFYKSYQGNGIFKTIENRRLSLHVTKRLPFPQKYEFSGFTFSFLPKDCTAQ